MKCFRHAITTLLLLGSTGLAATAQFLDSPASHAVIMDHETGEILFSKNGDQQMVPASMTKMMTAFAVFEMIENGEVALTDKMTVSENAWRKGGFPSGTSTMGLMPKDTPTVEELLHGIIIMSGNDACMVLAEGIAGSEDAFAKRMTLYAQELGLNSAKFVDTTGLSDQNLISAEDLAKLAKLTIDRYPDYYQWYDDQSYGWREYNQANRNPLLGVVDGADGLKTGFLSISGYGFTGSAVRDGVRRTIVFNGMDTKAARAQEAQRLMRVAFQSFDFKTVTPEGVSLPPQKVWLGQKKNLAISVGEDIKLAGHKRSFANAKTELVFPTPISAPVEKGDVVGQLVITLEGAEPKTAPVIAEESIGKMGFFDRALEGLGQLMSGGDA